MSESIVIVPSTANQDWDFLGFSFNGKHSWDDFKIIRTSDGDRYNINLGPQSQDKTAENPGGDGMYFFSSNHKQKVFDIKFAFEELDDVKLRKMKRWLSGKEVGDLWFDEEPYKVYSAKVTGQPSIRIIPFDNYDANGEKIGRVYKGDGSVQFTCYWPYAHTPDYVETETNMNTSGYIPTNNGKLWSKYNAFQNKNQWGLSSGLAIESNGSITDAFTTTCNGENPGDLPAPFIFKHNNGIRDLVVNANTSKTFKVGDLEITVGGTGSKSLTGVTWDSKTGMVSAKVDGASDYTPIPYTGTPTGGIPVGGITSSQLNLQGGTLTYHYWYY